MWLPPCHQAHPCAAEARRDIEEAALLKINTQGRGEEMILRFVARACFRLVVFGLLVRHLDRE